MQKGRLSPGISLVTVDVVDSVSSGPYFELLTCLTAGIAVSGSCSRRTVSECIEGLERVYIARSLSGRFALIDSAQVRTLPNSQLFVGTEVLGFWQPSRPRKPFFSFLTTLTPFSTLHFLQKQLGSIAPSVVALTLPNDLT